MKNKHTSFKKKLDLFKSKLRQNNHFIENTQFYVDMPSDILWDFITPALAQLYNRYNPNFKTKSVYQLPTDYSISWSFEDSKFNRTKEIDATRLVFRVSRRFSGRNSTLYRYFITLNKS